MIKFGTRSYSISITSPKNMPSLMPKDTGTEEKVETKRFSPFSGK